MRTPVAAILMLLAVAWPALAQPASDGRAVDQTVEDTDPRAVSLRVVDPGNAQFPTRSAMVERAHAASWAEANPGVAGPRRYEYRAPGVRAYIRQGEYVVVNQAGDRTRNAAPLLDGGFRAEAPPDTIFSLTPDAPAPLDPAAADPHWRDPRVEGRVNYNQPRHFDPGTAAAPVQTTPDGQRYIIRRIHTKTYKTSDQPADAAASESDDAASEAGTEIDHTHDHSPEEDAKSADDAHDADTQTNDS